MAVNNAQEAIQKRRVGEQLDNNNEDKEPVLADWPLRRATTMALLKCSRCGKIRYNIKFCSS